MFKKLFSDTVIYTIPTVFNRLIGVFFSIFLVRYLGPESFASVELVLLMLIFLERILSLEIDRGFGREVVKKTDEEISRYITTYLFFLLGNFLIFSFIFLFSPNYLLGRIFSENIIKIDFAIFFLVFVFSNLFYLKILEIFRWIIFSKTYSFLSLGGMILTSSLSFLFIYFISKSLESFVLGQLIGQFIMVIIGLIILQNKFKLGFVFKLEQLRKMITFSFPIFVFFILLYFLTYMDRWALNYFHSSTEVGIYSGIYRVTSILSIALLGSRLAFTPVAFRNIESKYEFSSIFHFIIFSLFSVGIFISGFAYPITNILVGSPYSDFSHLLPILILAKIFLTAFVFSPGLEIKKETKKMILIALTPLILGIPLTIFFTMQYSVLGTALSTCFSSLIFITTFLAINQRTGLVKYNWAGFLKLLIIFILNSLILTLLNSILIKLVIVLLSIYLFWKVLFSSREKEVLFKGAGEIKEYFIK